jgi:hypothetical protein
MIDAAERQDCKRLGCSRIGQVDHGDRVDFLQRNVGTRAIRRDRDVFRLDIGRCRLTGQQRYASLLQRRLVTVKQVERNRR